MNWFLFQQEKECRVGWSPDYIQNGHTGELKRSALNIRLTRTNTQTLDKDSSKKNHPKHQIIHKQTHDPLLSQ